MNSRHPHVIICDDNIGDLHMWALAFRVGSLQPMQISTAQNGERALEILNDLAAADHARSLLLADRLMPILDGPQLIKAVRAHSQFKNIPIVMMTGQVIQDNEAALADRLVTKPNTWDDYVALAKQLLAAYIFPEFLPPEKIRPRSPSRIANHRSRPLWCHARGNRTLWRRIRLLREKVILQELNLQVVKQDWSRLLERQRYRSFR
jgi:CheY-like chemotaxis protein